VVSLRSADPTSKAEVVARVGYEAESRERRAELVLSGPVTDTLKLRIAGLARKSDGYYYNDAVAIPVLGAAAPKYKRVQPEKSFILRATALWNPTSEFSARLKLNSYRTRVIHGGMAQFASCPDGTAGPFGIPFLAGDDCKLNRTVRDVDVDPTAFDGAWYGGVPTQKVRINFGSLELNYNLAPELTATSVTGYQTQHTNSMVTSTTTAAATVLLIQNTFSRKDFTQEFRLNSDYQGPLNFTLGAYYQDGFFRSSLDLPTNKKLGLPLPADLSKGHNRVFIKSYSVFGQGRFAVTPQLELAAGARWTDEIRQIKSYNDLSGVSVFVPVGVPRIQSKRLSPAVTLTYKPQDTVTVFAALKRGYKSGNYQSGGVPSPGADNSYGDEKVQGGEVGVKSRLLDRRLYLDVSAYNYKYSNLQVGTTITNSVGVPVATTINAGSAKVYGVEFQASYLPPGIEGLTLNASGGYNHGDFGTFNNVDCWFGQLVSEGCNRDLVGDHYTHQELSGTPLLRAPRWQANFGFDYERPFGQGMTIAITSSNAYSSKFVTFFGTRPDFYQKGYIKTDLSLTLRGPQERWEVAVIGKNLTGKITGSNCSAFNAQNGSILGPEVTGVVGSTTRGLAGVGELGCRLDPGREIWVRLTVRPLN
jgi:iron complex outermembrane receptor protein